MRNPHMFDDRKEERGMDRINKRYDWIGVVCFVGSFIYLGFESGHWGVAVAVALMVSMYEPARRWNNRV